MRFTLKFDNFNYVIAWVVVQGCSDKAVDIGESDTDVSKDEESHDEVQSEEASSVSVHESTKETRSMSRYVVNTLNIGAGSRD